MGNYRDFMSRRKCLVNALLWSSIPALQIVFFLKYGRTIESSGVIYALLLLVQLAIAAFHWYRYLAYHKKRTK